MNTSKIAQATERYCCKTRPGLWAWASCCFWLGRPLQTLHFLVLKLVVRKKEALLVTHSINLWLVLQAFSLRSFNQGVLCAGWSGSLSTRQISRFATREFGLNTESLTRVLHLNYFSGSGGCRCFCPPCPRSSIKGISMFAGSWFLWERPRLRLTFTNLSDSML